MLESESRRMITRLYEEVVNQGKLEVLDEIAEPDVVEHNPFPGQAQGVEGLRQRVSMVRGAFDPHFTIEHLLVDGDEVVAVLDWTRAHWGDPTEDLYHLVDHVVRMGLASGREVPVLAELACAAHAGRVVEIRPSREVRGR